MSRHEGDGVTRFTHAHSLRLWFSTVMAFVIATAMLIAIGFVAVPVASAATASFAQCNADTYPTGAGYEVNCTVTVVNTITAAGANTWYHVDDFHFLWKKVSGDVALTADITFPPHSYDHDPNPHRKAILMFRQTLDAGGIYADVAAHTDAVDI